MRADYYIRKFTELGIPSFSTFLNFFDIEYNIVTLHLYNITAIHISVFIFDYYIYNNVIN